MRRAPHLDLNHREITDALRRLGFSVFSTAAVGRGFPDLTAARQMETFLIEVKMPGAPFEDAQVAFYAHWNGTVYVFRSITDCVFLAGGGLNRIERWERGVHIGTEPQRRKK